MSEAIGDTMRSARVIATAARNSRFLMYPNRAIGHDVIQHATRDARRCADQEEEWIEVVDAVFRELVRESGQSIDAGGVELASHRRIDCSTQGDEQDAPIRKRAKRSTGQKQQLDAEVAGDRNVNHRWLMQGTRPVESMRENVLVGTILRLRQSRRMQELRRARRKLEASDATELLRNSNSDLRRFPMTGDGQRSVHGLPPDDRCRARKEI